MEQNVMFNVALRNVPFPLPFILIDFIFKGSLSVEIVQIQIQNVSDCMFESMGSMATNPY